MSSNVDTVIVPWFSRKEWIEVFCGTYSNNVDRWKEARDTMLVWQARVKKLPIGVDLTLPLLQARIVEANSSVDNDVKSIMQGTALQRFVSNVVKLPQTMYYHNQTLHKLAANIGLPAHLVDLRNEIIHGDSGWAGGCTISEALETSFSWIRRYYWLQEMEQMKKGKNKKVLLMTSVKWKYFLSKLDKYAEISARAVETKKLLKKRKRAKVAAEVILHLQTFFPSKPDKCIEAIVVHLLTPVKLQDAICNSGNRASCGCFFDLDFVKAVEVVLSVILTTEGSVELLLTALINKARDNREIVIEWIYLLIRSLIYLPTTEEIGYCQQHLLYLNNNGYMNWKKIVFSLLDLEMDWASDLSMRLLTSNETGFSKSQVMQIHNLLKLVGYDKINVKKEAQEVSDVPAESDLFSIESVVDHVSNLKSDRVNAFTLSSSISYARSPLGVLPHQMNDEQFYKELLLHYPEDGFTGPPLKRQKV